MAPAPPEPSIVQQAVDALRASLDIERDVAAIGPWPVAVGFIVGGFLLLLWGFRLYRLEAILMGVAIGALAGLAVAAWLQVNWIACLVAGALVCGVVAWPLVRVIWAIAFGANVAVVAALVTAAAAPASSEGLLLGAAVAGFVVGTAVGFMIFRFIVILASSLTGGAVLVLGVLRLVTLVPSLGDPVMACLRSMPWLALVLVLVPAVFGVIAQLGDEKTLPRKSRKSARKKEAKEAED